MCHEQCIGIPKRHCPYFKNNDCAAPSEFINARRTWDELRELGMTVIKGQKSEVKNEHGVATFAPWQVTSIYDRSRFQKSDDFYNEPWQIDYPMPGEFVNR
jgi:hypothetical protein